MPRAITRCRICENERLVSLLDLGDQYLTGVFPKSPNEPLTKGPLELVKCEGDHACGLVQLRHSYDSSEMYGANYGYRSGLNRSMVEHLRAKVAKLTALAAPRSGDLVLDIGSNDGTLLSFYPPELTTVGMDPTAAKFREFYQPRVEVIADFFSAAGFKARFGERRAKIVTSIAMFYDLDEPIKFVEQVAEILDEDGIWHFEQSYLPTMLEQNAYDTVCHEHVEYYALEQIKWMTDRCGLKIVGLEVNDVNGGSFALTVARKSSALPEDTNALSAMLQAEQDLGLDTLKPYQAFRERVFEHREKLLTILVDLARRGAKVLGYGASTKGNVILQFCGLTPAQIPAIAEVNPDKFGRFTPGSAIPIISETEAHAMQPDYLLVLPWHFRSNLVQREAAYLQRGGRMIFPLPKIEVFGQ
ncbi:MAG: class I SAM-dependent methyltransferase [Chthoniobacteraceae bacterium]